MTTLCLQFFSGDRERAMRLARFITDIETAPRPDVELCFVARFDCGHDEPTVLYASRRFAVSRFTTTTRQVGWPDGPSAMANDLLRHAAVNRKGDTLILLEPDCVPARRDWIDVLLREWGRARAEGKLLMGAWRDSGGPHGHINGCCVCVAELANHCGDIYVPGFAWDCAVAPALHGKWRAIDAIRNHFQSKNALPSVLVGDPALVHGFKDDSMERLARERML